MIILITGASHTGKTALAQKLLEKYKYPYLSIDHLKMGLIRSGNTTLTPMSDDKALTDYLWPIVCEMVKTAIENRQNLIVEGCYIPFDWPKDLTIEYLEHIQYYCLVMSERYIKNHFQDIKAYANVVENRMDDEGCTIETVLKENAEIQKQCDAHKVRYLLIDEKYCSVKWRMGMKIRHAKIEDLDILAEIEALSYPKAEGASKESIKGRLEHFPEYFWILENEDKEVVSFINGMLTDRENLTDDMYDQPETHEKDGDWLIIFSVVTAPAYRGNGHAGFLMKQVIEDLKAEKRKGIVLTCKEKLLGFYSQFGFVNEGISTSTHGDAVWYQMRMVL